MDLPEWLTDYWVVCYFAGDALLFLVAYLLWNAGTRAVAVLFFLFAVCLPLAFVTVLIEPTPE
ncbi:hypothetical protein BRD09_04810 [Halobacteriales archaeon SW_10_68_16]|jgi:hypothetical protein|nr:MAG: hypothetical protein BRD09_04810 [Halobacteriales archaeon SW_10_68_16]